jgi:hypothetical protein
VTLGAGMVRPALIAGPEVSSALPMAAAPLARRPSQLPKLVHDCVGEQRPTALSNGIQLVSSVYEELPDVEGDAMRLQQVINNLIGMRFTGPCSGVSAAGRKLRA